MIQYQQDQESGQIRWPLIERVAHLSSVYMKVKLILIDHIYIFISLSLLSFYLNQRSICTLCIDRNDLYSWKVNNKVKVSLASQNWMKGVNSANLIVFGILFSDMKIIFNKPVFSLSWMFLPDKNDKWKYLKKKNKAAFTWDSEPVERLEGIQRTQPFQMQHKFTSI